MKCRIAIFLLAALPFLSHAQTHTKSFVDVVTGGTYTWTNNIDGGGSEKAAYELKQLMFTDPDGGSSNFMTMAQQREIRIPSTSVVEVVTNAVTHPDTGNAWITTNTHWISRGKVTVTNTVDIVRGAAAVTTTQVFDEDDFEKGWTFEPFDVSIFTFDNTSNTIYLIRVYDVYPRP